MYRIELKISPTRYVTIYFSTALTVFEAENGYTCIMDGMHNNGGWRIPAAYYSYGEIVEMIDKVIKGEK